MSFSLSGLVGSVANLVSPARKKAGEKRSTPDGQEEEEETTAETNKKVKFEDEAGKEDKGGAVVVDFRKELDNIQRTVNSQILEIGERYKGIEVRAQTREEEVKILKQMVGEKSVEVKSEKVEKEELRKKNQELLSALRAIEIAPSRPDVLRITRSLILAAEAKEKQKTRGLHLLAAAALGGGAAADDGTGAVDVESADKNAQKSKSDCASPGKPADTSLEDKNAVKGDCFEDKDDEDEEKREPGDVEPVTEVEYDKSLSLDQIKGWDKAVSFLRESVLVPFANQELFKKNGVGLAKGIVFFDESRFGLGPFVAKTLAAEMSKILGGKVTMFQRKKSQMFSRYGQECKFFLTDLFDAAIASQPSVIFIDDLPSIYWHYRSLGPDLGVLGFFSSLLERIVSGQVLVVASVDDLKRLPNSLRSPTRFDSIIHFPAATAGTRKVALNKICSKWEKKPTDDMLDKVSKKSEGFSYEELLALCRDAYRNGIQRLSKASDSQRCKNCKCDPSHMTLDDSELTTLEITKEDWQTAFVTAKEIKSKKSPLDDDPLARMQDELSSVLNLSNRKKGDSGFEAVIEGDLGFTSVGGLDEQVEILMESIIFPFANKDSLKEWGMEPAKGLIFHGPPGSGKTLLAKALAAELSRLGKNKFSFIYHKGTDCYGPYVGQTQGNLKRLFERAKACKPCILFFDEIDGLCSQRDSDSGIGRFHNGVVATMLGLMDNVTRGEVVVIAATNRLESLDPALMRPGRFDKTVAFFSPKEEGRVKILEIHTRAWKRRKEGEVLKQIAKQTPGYSGADLEQLCRQTFLMALRRHFPVMKEGSVDLKKTEGFKDFEILPQDWYSAMVVVKASRSNVFGNGATQEVSLPLGVSVLLSGIVEELVKELQPFVTNSTKTAPTTPGKGSGINSFLLWGSGAKEAKAIENFLIPSLMAAMEDTLLFTIDEDCLNINKKLKLTALMNQVLTSGEGKTVILFVPGMDKLHLLIKEGNELQHFMEQIDLLRGENVLLLATAGCPISELWEDFRPIFKGLSDTRSYKLRKLEGAECAEFFREMLEANFLPELKRVEKLAAGRNLYDILDLKAALTRACDLLKGTKGMAADEEKKQVRSEMKKILDAFEKSDNGEFRHCMYT